MKQATGNDYFQRCNNYSNPIKILDTLDELFYKLKAAIENSARHTI